jgi:hypothetical protein
MNSEWKYVPKVVDCNIHPEENGAQDIGIGCQKCFYGAGARYGFD